MIHGRLQLVVSQTSSTCPSLIHDPTAEYFFTPDRQMIWINRKPASSQMACMVNPFHICSWDRRPSMSSTGNAIAQRKGSASARVWMAPGSRSIGAMRPERNRPSVKYIWLMASLRVVQKATRARVHSMKNRMRNAMPNASKKTANVCM